MGRIPKHLRKEIGRCRSCKELIWWGYRYGRPFPYNVGFESDGTPYRRGPHKETCPFASEYQPSSRGNLRARADAHTEAVNRWKQSCVSDKVPPDVDWTTLAIHDVPEKHAVRLAVKLTERGGPFEMWHAMDAIRHFYGIAVEEKRVVAILITPALFNRNPCACAWVCAVGVRGYGGTQAGVGGGVSFGVEQRIATLQPCNLAEPQEMT